MASVKQLETNDHDVSLIKYYLDGCEKNDPRKYTTDYTRPGPAILSLITLYCILRHTYVYFRLHVAKELESRNKDNRLLPVGTILLNFFIKRVYNNKKDFETRCPSLTQMISIASEASLTGSTMVSANMIV